MPDLFDRISYRDIFSRIDFKDVFDRIDLPVEEKVIFSKEMRDLIREELIKRIADIPIGTIISSIVKKEIRKKIEEDIPVRALLEKRISEINNQSKEKVEKVNDKVAKVKEEFGSLKAELEEGISKLKEKYDSVKNDVMTIHGSQWYQFGGFSPQVNFSNVFYFGDQNTDGSWRIVVDGTNLSIQYRESGSWVEKGSFLP